MFISITSTENTEDDITISGITRKISDTIWVTYELLQDVNDCNIFSIKLTEYNKSESGNDEETLYDISRNIETAREIFGLLVKNSVTPCCLYECLDEIFNII